MKTSEVAKRIDLGASTLRQWTKPDAWGNYLSKNARSGRRRDFTERDAQILLYIRDEKARGTSYNDIHASLKNMQSSGWLNLPKLPAPPVGEGPVSMTPTARVEELRAAYVREVALLQDKIDDLTEDLADETDRREELERELTTTKTELAETRGRLQGLQGELAKLEREAGEVVKLEREAGELRGKLDTLAQQDTRQTRLWLAVIVGALLAAGGIGALVAFLLSSTP
ncbi:MAG: MerR family transcriptional regulator [Chloroflexota bacterium]